MGIPLFFSVLLLWVYLIGFCVSPTSTTLIGRDTICDLDGCNCTKRVDMWKIVNCTFDSAQEIHLKSSHVPLKILEIFINGGKKIVFAPNSFDMLPRLSLLEINDVRTLVMEKQSFYNLTDPSLLMKIQNCDRLTIKTGAFENMQSAFRAEITQCAHVSVEKSAFSKLHVGRFKDINQLILATGTFEFKNQGNLGKHGPVTVISFDNVTIPNIPPQTFFSTLAEISIHNSKIRDINKDAFWATQIGAISITNSGIDCLKSDAFIDRTLIASLKIHRCNITTIESKAVMAAISNLTVEFCRITDIEKGAINSTIANIDFISNEIVNFHKTALTFNKWNKINIQQNVIKKLDSYFLVAPVDPGVLELKFTGNEVYNLEPGALSFVPNLDDKVFHFENNYFDEACHCSIDKWIEKLIIADDSKKIKMIMNNTFCTINELLFSCFELPVGLINIQNFTELVCNSNNTIICEPYNGETKIVNTTSKIFADEKPKENTSWLTLIITCTSLLVIAFLATFVFLLIRGGRWLKRKGYFLKIQYSQNEQNNDEEVTTVTEDAESDKFDMPVPKELTEELLQNLRERLNDPNTTQEASEMIYRLYEMFVVDDNYENNNRQDEDAHLYEELGNLQAPQLVLDENLDDGTRSIQQLNEIEQKLYPQVEFSNGRPALAGDYSEPSDAAEHLYSELKQNKLELGGSDNRSSLKSTTSASGMAFRPLPDMPGPSTKM